MDGLTLTLWVMSGTFIGGVATPIVTEDRTINDWLSMLIGVIVGGIGNVLLLIPLWSALRFLLPQSEDTHLKWERDTISLEQVRAASGAPVSPLDLLAKNLWPNTRADGHSHRMSYVGVFVALAVITAIEVLITVIGVGTITSGLLAALSTSKVMLVAMFFMHLRYDSKWYSGIFIYAFPFAALIVIVLALA
jgi:cytochrome c oxidase subunit 4